MSKKNEQKIKKSKYSLDIEQAVIGSNGLSTQRGWIRVYRAAPYTREFMQASMEYLYLGVSVAASAYTDAPELPTDERLAVVRSADGSKWETVEDNRGLTAYHTVHHQPVEVDFLGPLPDTLTLLKPNGDFDVWDGQQWVTDTEAQQAYLTQQAQQEKEQRMELANQTITYLQDAIELALGDDSYPAKLAEWKKYRILLNRVDLAANPVVWPEVPASL